ncbi:non-canonical purine NTP pyrophosphatase [Saccharopolyspora sp. 6M]|uniref:non-canonical purine NTP pyrophosphatase n=1 Tax=Saccharopolyspora sp. 6M TaxID=2877237 RepID=UPI001CD378ED|nr:non-canonical purine NTP pyrophosphatase [Saccharopolyspora sp. 6M]MCA1229399.1 non-canonical purine NTP pyrophosphatase [Saccharopolyspora sp. 6M]
MIDHLSLITGNAGKAAEYAELLEMPVTPVQEDLLEIQSLDVEEVVRHKAHDAYLAHGAPVLVDDTALTLLAWNGLPGALIVWFLKARGVEGLLTMAAEETDRTATVTTAIGYADAHGVQVFTGNLHGALTRTPRGTNGFGYDSIFVPDGHDRTYAEMTPEEKNELSHRRLAVNALRTGLGLTTETNA